MELKDVLIYIIFPVIAGLIIEVLKGFPLSMKVLTMFIKKKKEQPKQGEIPEFTQYTKDVFEGFVYRWEWIKVCNGWQIRNVTICCPKDETQLVLESMYYIKCPRCKKVYDNLPDIESAQVVIQDNVSRKYSAISV